MSKWFLVNSIFLMVVVWKVLGHYSYPNIGIHIWFGIIGAILILYNWTRHAVFQTIRNVQSRRTKIWLANISKRVVTIHRWTGNIAFGLLSIHAFLVISRYGFSLQHTKMVVGLIALAILAIQVLTGWLRLFKPTIQLRFFHLYTGMALFFLIWIHILL
ncbi:hypothetical protein [Ornithinibacillus sp. FSL M8-0202]|uniref:hypothetical protein n=1 Tax=Ornithinibacillus sp. FSL M8-0202 TaxID=2921616 RepID=UPI0030CE82DC